MKGALTEHVLPGVKGMRHDELRTLLAAQPDFAYVKPVMQAEVEHILLFGHNATPSACTLKCVGHM